MGRDPAGVKAAAPDCAPDCRTRGNVEIRVAAQETGNGRTAPAQGAQIL